MASKSSIAGPRILWIARELPLPLDAGDRLYTARLVEALATAGAQVHYLGLWNPDAGQPSTTQLDGKVRWEIVPGLRNSSLRSILQPRPFVAGAFHTASYRSRLTALLASEAYDVVVIDQYGMEWAADILAAHPSRRHWIVAHIGHDFETHVIRDLAAAYRGNPIRKLALLRNARLTATAERKLARTSDLMVTLSPSDLVQFQAIGSTEGVVIPPGYDGPRRDERRIDQTVPSRVAIVGSYAWIAKQLNLAAFLEAADAKFAAAGVELVVVGRAPEAFVDRLAPNLKASRFLGFVEDLDALMDSCRMGLVIEETGGGFKLKVLDYVFRRLPVGALAPSLGGQDPEVTRHFLVRDTAAQLADAVIETIERAERLNAMQDRAYQAAARAFNWSENASKFLAAVERIGDRRAEATQ